MVCERAERAVQLPLEPVSCDRIDAALEQLTMLEAANCHSEPTRGRSASLWSANAVREPDEHQGFLNDLEEFVAKGGGL